MWSYKVWCALLNVGLFVMRQCMFNCVVFCQRNTSTKNAFSCWICYRRRKVEVAEGGGVQVHGKCHAFAFISPISSSTICNLRGGGGGA